MPRTANLNQKVRSHFPVGDDLDFGPFVYLGIEWYRQALSQQEGKLRCSVRLIDANPHRTRPTAQFYDSYIAVRDQLLQCRKNASSLVSQRSRIFH
jgi:hypothetical protein